MRRAATAGALVTAQTVTNKPARLSRFVDSIRIQFRGGKGGNGCISMSHLFANEFAGPDGGNGGCGGHVVLRANRQVKSFNGLLGKYTGLAGANGMGKTLFGSNADHVFVEVPVGTIVTPAKPKEVSETDYDPDKSDIIAFLDQEGSMFIAARGGAGGRGNASYLSNFNRHPKIAEAGANGETNVYDLRMRLYAHVGLIGLPNAGKSTLLRTLTGAQVEIGNYAFTTKHPQVGIIEFDDFAQVAISDLPGLIEESHKNRGLGLNFLRSIKRCACLLFVIDMTREPIKQLETLIQELELFSKGLSHRPHLVLANKMDDPQSVINMPEFVTYLNKVRPETRLVKGSSMRGDNLEQLRQELRKMYDIYRDKHADDIDELLEW